MIILKNRWVEMAKSVTFIVLVSVNGWIKTMTEIYITSTTEPNTDKFPDFFRMGI